MTAAGAPAVERRGSHEIDVLYLLIALSVVLVVTIAAALLWAVRAGQFDDLEGPTHRMLMDEDEKPPAAMRLTGIEAIDNKKVLRGFPVAERCRGAPGHAPLHR